MKCDAIAPIGKNLHYFIKWSMVSGIIGALTGLAGSFFGHAVLRASALFRENSWLLYLLPAAGLLIVLIYHLLGEDKSRGTNTVLEAVYSETDISIGMAPLVFLGSVLTHICGGSSGKEGAALQMGGSIGSFIGKKIHLDEKDKKIAVMCGMSGALRLFGLYRCGRCQNTIPEGGGILHWIDTGF